MEKKTKKLKELIGDRCILCGKTPQTNQGFAFHEIYGEKHPYSGSSRLKYILEHPEDFVPLCRKCHTGVHFCMKFLGLTWNDLNDKKGSWTENKNTIKPLNSRKR